MIPLAAAMLLLGGAAVHGAARDGVAPNAGPRPTLGRGGWTAITLRSLGGP